MVGRRSLFVALALALAAGCSPGGGAVAPFAGTTSNGIPSSLDGSSAAHVILANVASARTTLSDHDADDGGRGALVLPALNDCGNGTFATDCSVWSWSRNPHGGRSDARAVQSLTTVVGTPPILNFCAAAVPADFTPAAPLVTYSVSTFSLAYTGTHAPPIASFNTRPWVAALANTFSSTSDSATAMTLTPTLANAAARGWLAFFTWSWPADILLVPYAVDEIQAGAGSSPLAVPHDGSAALDAFDCLGRAITAQREGTGFGFSANLQSGTASSSGPELQTTVYGTNASGSILLGDDRGARTVVTVSGS